MVRVIVWLVTGATFFLSLWIVLPAPNLFFLRLAVGAPEVSPVLAVISAIALIAARWMYPRPPRLLIVLLLISLLFSSWPLLQQPRTVANAEASMAAVFQKLEQQVSLPKTATPFFNPVYFLRGLPSDEVRIQTDIPFASPSGVPLALDLYQPAKSGTYPTVITIYGGSWSSGSPKANAQFSRFLAAKGYVVAAIDYRHAPQYRFPAQLDDVQTAIAVVRDRAKAYEIDPNRISLVGWSAGAHLAMLAGFQAPHTFRSIIDYYGPVDLAKGYADPPRPDPINVRQILRAFIGGPPEALLEAYIKASPITYAKTAKPKTLPPVLLIYGGRDHVVEAKFGKRLQAAITMGGNQAVWLKIPWAEHAFDKVFNGVSNQMALYYVERFLDQTLHQ